jgi:hypothetical protein
MKKFFAVFGLFVIAGLCLAARYEQLSVGELTIDSSAQGPFVLANSNLPVNIAQARITNALAAVGVWGTPLIAATTNNGTNATVNIRARTIAGGTLSERRLLRIWIAQSANGSATTQGLARFSLLNGVSVDVVTTNADYRQVTTSTGTVSAVVNSTATSTNYIMVTDGSSATSSAAIIFLGP